MNTYVVARWGNPDEGPNGEDTNFLVVASSPAEAGRLADECLSDHPWLNGDDVQSFCQLVVELGISASSTPAVIHGPWVANTILRACELASWERFGVDLPFTLHEDPS